MMANLRAGLIGLGMMGRHHARVLGSLPGVDLVGMVDPDGDKFKVAGGRPLYATVDELLEHKLDYCMVAVPTALHEEVGLRLAAAGVHALVEKPIANTLEAANRLQDAFEKAGLVGGVGHIERFNPAVQQARSRIESGLLGRILQISTRRQGPFPGRIADVGVVMDLASHDIDLTQYVTDSTYRRVSAHAAFRSGRQYEDLVAVTGQMITGVVANHLVNWLSPFKERVTVVLGDEGSLVIDTLTADLTFHRNGTELTEWADLAQFKGVSEGDSIRYAFPKREPLLVEHENFRDTILGKGGTVVTFKEGVHTISVAAGVLTSAQEQREVDFLRVDV